MWKLHAYDDKTRQWSEIGQFQSLTDAARGICKLERDPHGEPRGGGAGVEHIEIRSTDGDTVAEWRHGDLWLRLAADDLLEALEQALVALNTAPRFSVPILGVIDSYAVAAICETAIAKAKGNAA